MASPAGFIPDVAAAEDPPRFRIKQTFEDARRFVHLDRACDRSEGHRGHLVGDPLFFRLAFGQANAGQRPCWETGGTRNPSPPPPAPTPPLHLPNEERMLPHTVLVLLP